MDGEKGWYPVFPVVRLSVWQKVDALSWNYEFLFPFCNYIVNYQKKKKTKLYSLVTLFRDVQRVNELLSLQETKKVATTEERGKRVSKTWRPQLSRFWWSLSWRWPRWWTSAPSSWWKTGIIKEGRSHSKHRIFCYSQHLKICVWFSFIKWLLIYNLFFPRIVNQIRGQ